MQHPSPTPLNRSPRTRWGRLGHLLQTSWTHVARFMVLRPQAASPQAIDPANQPYSTNARFHPYLPASAEQRDWLERVYHQS